MIERIIKADLLTTTAELKADVAALETRLIGEIHSASWKLLGVIVGQTGVYFGLMYFFSTHVVK